MIKKLLAHVHRVKKHKKHISLGFLSLLFILGTSFVLAKNFPIHSSELNFKEYSILGKTAGSVIPASCVSGVHDTHPYDINYDTTIDSGCVPVCSSGQVLQTNQQYRCMYQTNNFTFNPSTGETRTGPNAYFTAWQATIPSCPANAYQYTTLSTFLQIETRNYENISNQTKDVYSCVSLPGSPTNVTATCNSAGTQVTVSWTAGSGATVYYPRVGAVSGQSCPSGWTASNSTDCYKDNYSGTLFTYTTVPNKAYTSWIHSGSSSGINWTQNGSVAFTCTPPPTVNLNFSLIDSVRIFIKDFFANIAENPITKVSAEVINKY